MILPEFRGHRRRRENAPGGVHGQTAATTVHRGVQAGGGPALPAARPQHRAGRSGVRPDRVGPAQVGAAGRWVQQYEVDHGPNPSGALTMEEKTELRTLRREVRVLHEEREILKNCPTGGTVSCRDRNSRTAYAAKQPRGAVVCFLVALTPLKTLAHGRLRTCEW